MSAPRTVSLASWLLACSGAVALAQEPPPAPAPAQPASVPAVPDAPIEVTVVGTRLSQTAGSAHVIDEKQLSRFEYDDPTAVLMSTPGLYVRTEDGMGLRPNIGLRGVNPDRSKKVTLLEDGVLLGPAPYSAAAAYYFPIITRMSKVRVIKGPSAISYGPQTVAGAVDLVTRPIPRDLASGVDVAVGQYGYGKAHVHAGASTDRLGFLIEGVRLQNNGFKELPSGADTGFTRNEWMVKASYLVDPEARVQNELRVKLTYSDETSNESYLGLSDADFQANPNQRYAASQLDRMKNHRTSIVLTHQLDPSPNLSITTNVYRHNFSRAWRKVNAFSSGSTETGYTQVSLFDVLTQPNSARNPAYLSILKGGATSGSTRLLIGPNERAFVSQGIESRLRWSRPGKLAQRLEAGARYHYDSIERKHSQSAYSVAGDALYPERGLTEITALNRELTHAVALHVAYALTYRDLTLTPGLRTELYRMVSDDHLARRKQKEFGQAVLPGVGAYYALYRGLGLLAGVHQGFSAPPPGSGGDVDPEKSINYEAGARYSDRQLRVEGIYFYNDYRNLTDYCSASSGCSEAQLDRQYDAGRARIYGVEGLLEHELPLGPVRLPIGVSYTYTEAQFLEDFQSEDPIFGNVRRGDDIPYVPKHQVRAQLGVEHRLGGVNAALTYVGKMREAPGQGAYMPQLTTDRQLLVDVAGFAKIWGPLSLYANVQNLFDSQYIVSRRPFGARPNAPRWTHVGVRATF